MSPRRMRTAQKKARRGAGLISGKTLQAADIFGDLSLFVNSFCAVRTRTSRPSFKPAAPGEPSSTGINAHHSDKGHWGRDARLRCWGLPKPVTDV